MSEDFRLDRSGEASNFSSERKVGWLLKMGKVYTLVHPFPLDLWNHRLGRDLKMKILALNG
jgi:hypothetical protein